MGETPGGQGREDARDAGAAALPAGGSGDGGRVRIGIAAAATAIVLCVAQSVVTILGGNSFDVSPTDTLIPILTFAVLFLLLFAINPVLRLLHARLPLNRAELMAIFAAMFVTAGISTYGLTEQLIPIMAAPYNPDWNVPQRGWDKDVNPHLNPKLYFGGEEVSAGQRLDAAVKAARGTAEGDGAGGKEAPAQKAEPLNAGMVRDVSATIRAEAAWLRGVADRCEARSKEAGRAAEDLDRGGPGAEGDAARRRAEAELKRENAKKLSDEAGNRRAEADKFDRLAASLPSSIQDAPDAKTLDSLAAAAETCRQIGAERVRGFRQGLKRGESLWSDVRWGHWLRPIGYWMIFVLGTYGIFYFLSAVLYDYWARREKLIFPLARFPVELLPGEDQPKGAFPRIVRSPLFWVGFFIAFAPLTWNAIVGAEMVKGLGRISLGGDWTTYDPLFAGTILQGLSGGWVGFRTLIIFTAIGIAFLLPLQISFSAWFYFLIGQSFILTACWLGYGTNQNSFPTDWMWDNNMVTAQAAGGMLCFAAMCLWKCLVDLREKANSLPREDRLRAYRPAIGLLACYLLVSGWLMWNRIGAPWALAFTAVCTLVTIGLMRIVAEGGIFWFQVHVGPFHLARVTGALPSLKLGGLAGSLTGLWKVPAPVLAALLPIYSVLFLDIKTFLAPNLLCSFKVQEETRAQRSRFHAVIVLAMLASVAASLIFYVALSYYKGGAQMNSWFASSGPQLVMEKAVTVVRENRWEGANTAWYGTGMGWVLFSTWIRNKAFWFPHPIGYIMLVNPLMQCLWFSFLIGWAAKKVVVTYGGKETFEKVRAMFIGLILGEIFACGLWGALALAFNWPGVRLNLNRYRA